MDKLILLVILALYASSATCRPRSTSGPVSSNSKAKPSDDDDDDGAVPITVMGDDDSEDNGPVTNSGGARAYGQTGKPYTTHPRSASATQETPEGSMRQMLSQPLDFDGNDDDIEDFDFGLDDLDDEEIIDINANTIPAKSWVVILENFDEVLDNYDIGDEDQQEKLEKDISTLKEMEEILVSRGKDDFEENEPEERKLCARLEYEMLDLIKDLDPKDQNYVLDVDKDGVADYSFA